MGYMCIGLLFLLLADWLLLKLYYCVGNALLIRVCVNVIGGSCFGVRCDSGVERHCVVDIVEVNRGKREDCSEKLMCCSPLEVSTSHYYNDNSMC